MKKNAKKKETSQAPHPSVQAILTQLVLPLGEMLRGQLHQFVIDLGMQALHHVVEQERMRLCGPRYQHNDERACRRNGSVPSELVLGGRKVKLRRPRVVRSDGREVPLETWEYFSSTDAMDERMLEQMAIGVSTRKYERSLEPMSSALESSSTSKSNVSRHFIAATESALREWMARNLSDLNLAAIFIDGIYFAEHVVLLALGVDVEGKKHVIGLWEGATENAVACRSMLANMIERGLPADRSTLFIIDGSSALRAAIRDVFGPRGLVQRCQVHKVRNVISHLPEKKHAEVERVMRQAYHSKSSKTAKKQLENLAHTLRKEYPSAAASLLEGLDETLTVLDFHLNESLTRTLSTTNPIENLNDRVRTVTRRVKRWRGGEMILRWVAVGLMEAERGFRALKGKADMPRLVAILRSKDRQLQCQSELPLDVQQDVA